VVNLSELKYAFIRTSVERPLMKLRYAAGFLHRRRSPELGELYAEDKRIDLLLKILGRESNCIDVGCHLRFDAESVLLIGAGRSSRCREAIPSKVAFLRRKFPEVHVFETARSDHFGTVSFTSTSAPLALAASLGTLRAPSSESR
jgi:hypothetical protein